MFLISPISELILLPRKKLTTTANRTPPPATAVTVYATDMIMAAMLPSI